VIVTKTAVGAIVYAGMVLALFPAIATFVVARWRRPVAP
jgi:hypothetical protein